MSYRRSWFIKLWFTSVKEFSVFNTVYSTIDILPISFIRIVITYCNLEYLIRYQYIPSRRWLGNIITRRVIQRSYSHQTSRSEKWKPCQAGTEVADSWFPFFCSLCWTFPPGLEVIDRDVDELLRCLAPFVKCTLHFSHTLTAFMYVVYWAWRFVSCLITLK